MMPGSGHRNGFEKYALSDLKKSEGLDPGIHHPSQDSPDEMDGLVKPGDDGTSVI
jgi:hypothetical protein